MLSGAQSDALAQEGQGNGKDEMQELKEQIREMQEEKRQRDDYLRRLQRKITKLNATLADEVEKEEGLRRKQDHDRTKEDDENSSLKREMDIRKANQEDRIREYLSDVLYTKAPSNVAKQFELDTVRVMNPHFQHPLAFRIDDGTTVMKLLRNACKYWNVPPDNYILKTMANNKCSDEIRVKECFKQGELAQLRLEEKPKQGPMESTRPSEEELKAIMPKGKGRKARHRNLRYNAEGVEKIQRHIDNYALQLRQMGGIYFLPRLRDMKPSEHVSKIRPRDIVIYTVLVILSFWVYNSRRPEGHDYWFQKGIEEPFLQRMPRDYVAGEQYTTYVPGFKEVQSLSDIWDWLETTLPAKVWSQSAFGLGACNMLVGYMSIRVKSIAVPEPKWANCEKDKALVEQLGGACYAAVVRGESERTADFPELVEYWNAVRARDENDPQRIRGPANPGRWVSAEENKRLHNIGTLAGYLERYDGSGYSVHYRMDATNKTKAVSQYLEDLGKFKEVGWISLESRAVILSFTTYNFDYDRWLASDLLFEISPSGATMSYAILRVFRLGQDENEQELAELYVDFIRLIIAVYILVFVGINERRHKIKHHKAGAWYHVSLNGITDAGIVICIFTVVLWRYIEFRGLVPSEQLEQLSRASEPDAGFHSFSNLAMDSETIFCVEGLIVVFLMYRMLSFFRLNHTIFLLWKSLGRAGKSFAFFMLIIVPAMLGFILLMHSRYGAYMDSFSDLQGTVLHFIARAAGGRQEHDMLLQLDVVGGTIFAIAYYLGVMFLALNICATIMLDAYYAVQITAGGPGEEWTRQRLYKWAVPSLLVNLLQALVPSQGRDTEGG